MKVLGFRADQSAPRYAIVGVQCKSFVLVNAASESKLVIPPRISDIQDEQRLIWLFQEIERILDNQGNISKVVIKANEYIGMDSKTRRKSNFQEAIVMLCCAQRKISVVSKTYRALHTTSSKTQSDAETRVARTSMYWNSKMADAVNAAWWGMLNS